MIKSFLICAAISSLLLGTANAKRIDNGFPGESLPSSHIHFISNKNDVEDIKSIDENSSWDDKNPENFPIHINAIDVLTSDENRDIVFIGREGNDSTFVMDLSPIDGGYKITNLYLPNTNKDYTNSTGFCHLNKETKILECMAIMGIPHTTKLSQFFLFYKLR